MLTATIVTELIKALNVDGVIYPSVMASGQAGINIALSPHSAYQKLEFRPIIIEQCLYKNLDNNLLLISSVFKGSMNEPYFVDTNNDKIICERLGVMSIEDLPLVNHH